MDYSDLVPPTCTLKKCILELIKDEAISLGELEITIPQNTNESISSILQMSLPTGLSIMIKDLKKKWFRTFIEDLTILEVETAVGQYNEPDIVRYLKVNHIGYLTSSSDLLEFRSLQMSSLKVEEQDDSDTVINIEVRLVACYHTNKNLNNNMDIILSRYLTKALINKTINVNNKIIAVGQYI
ncbi:hypothetical protein A3Q56_02379 [Intoshia linei]|uniref:Uncharacterized protein n=1 Tax=Intoshia linei TaxID=1819745 RepID=A0A177B6J8_9BILA|nr:hypothetical protein A3Q56_02379 [Intoshia linei]